MVKRTIDRRTAIACLVGLIGGAGGIGALVGHQGAPPTPVEAQTPSPNQGVPANWNDLQGPMRVAMFSIHSNVQSLEAVGQHAYVHSLIQSYATQGLAFDQHKEYIAKYVRETGRGDLLPSLLAGLNPALTSPGTRRLLIGAVSILITERPDSIPATVRPALKSYLASGSETDASIRGLLRSVIRRL